MAVCPSWRRGRPMDRELVLALVQVVPAVLWVALAGFVVVKLRGPLGDEVLPRLPRVKVGGVAGRGRSIEEGRAALERPTDSFDLVISEMRGAGKPDAGLELLRRLR